MVLNDPYGFIYITTNWKNGKKYIGRKIFDTKGHWKSYKGGGSDLKKDMKVYGVSCFTKSIIDIAYSEDELNEKERSYIRFFRAQDSENFYNHDEGGLHPKQRIQFRGKNNPMYGKHLSEESKAKLREALKGRISSNKGKTASEETKKKQRESWIRRKEKGGYIGTKKPVIVNETGQRFDSLTDACKSLNINYGSAINVINGKRRSVYGYSFRYVGGYINTVKEGAEI